MFADCLMLFIYRRTTLSGGPLFTMLHMKEKLKKRNNIKVYAVDITNIVHHETHTTFYTG
jgi:hypothetical protein